MKNHVHTFESFLNEGKDHGDITAAMGGDDKIYVMTVAF